MKITIEQTMMVSYYSLRDYFISLFFFLLLVFLLLEILSFHLRKRASRRHSSLSAFFLSFYPHLYDEVYANQAAKKLRLLNATKKKEKGRITSSPGPFYRGCQDVLPLAFRCSCRLGARWNFSSSSSCRISWTNEEFLYRR